MAEGVLAEIAERKRRDVAERLVGVSFDPQPTPRSLRKSLARPGARFIMEVKKASPSGHRSGVSVEQAVAAYAPVADAISVLTDTPFFSGSLEDLRTVRSRFDGPILAKDFIVDARQVGEARLHGADAALVILAMLDDGEATNVMAEARRLSMDVIVEVHDEGELQRALMLGAGIIGINNRDLRTLRTNLAVTERLIATIPNDRIVISESGIRDRRDVQRLSKSVDAFLVGSSLMAAPDISGAVRALVYGRVKICGVTKPEDAELAVQQGATHVGMIFAEGSPRRVLGDARAIAEAARAGGVKPVGVFQDQDPEAVVRMAHDFDLAVVQLHGSEKVEEHRDGLPAECEVWATCAVGSEATEERSQADRILYDTKVNGRAGGTGKVFDWDLIAGRAALSNAFLAGGISPANARDAQTVGSYGIDLCSGVEVVPGVKDPEKVSALFGALRPDCRRTA